MNPVEVYRGSSPVILGFPHVGTHVPPAVHTRLNDNGRWLADTDWHLTRLYDGLLPDATTVCATFHRYVIDANRDPGGGSLYPGQNTTGLVPLTDFNGLPIWNEGAEPTPEDTAARLARFHAPYHAALATEIARVKSLHGAAVLYDCHSIRSGIPFLFEGTLPDFNVGTGNQRRVLVPSGATGERRRRSFPGTCCQALETAVMEGARDATGFTRILNGRFRGGWSTRHYGAPETREVHAVQMELAQSTYLLSESPPFAYDEEKAAVIRPHLRAVLERVERVAFQL